MQDCSDFSNVTRFNDGGMTQYIRIHERFDNL